MTVVTPLAPGEHPAGFPHGSGHPAVPGPREAIRRILAEGARSGRLTHVEEIPGRSGELGVWPPRRVGAIWLATAPKRRTGPIF